MDAICTANAKVMALLVAAAPAEAGSYHMISKVLYMPVEFLYLMLRDGGNLRIGSGNCGTQDAGKSNAAGISLQSSVDQSSSHTVDIASGLCIGECLVGCGLVETVGV
jgi:hypothetical protein